MKAKLTEVSPVVGEKKMTDVTPRKIAKNVSASPKSAGQSSTPATAKRAVKKVSVTPKSGGSVVKSKQAGAAATPAKEKVVSKMEELKGVTAVSESAVDGGAKRKRQDKTKSLTDKNLQAKQKVEKKPKLSKQDERIVSTSGAKLSEVVKGQAESLRGDDEDIPGDFLPLDGSLAPVRNTGGDKHHGAASLGETDKPRVVYIGRIPHGFYEEEMSGFFGQFGTITNLRISRNKKTGKSKHYGFFEFESPEVAAIVVECMHNYLLFGSMLQCKLVPPESVHPALWKGANREFKVVPWVKLAQQKHNRERTPEQVQRVMTRLVKRQDKRMEKLKAAGIDYDFEGFRALVPAKAKHVKYDD
eukprot:TRINITY_DN4270_c0_g1_i1.p1 TRINITY_DN4270_c0_g1~~TRINITY_DN4270_c0_g1_i1.p1  ORF type:complete len:420 (-),score=123.73 TRINITY_DN4270_c0_g1_i1:610-1683(-)